MATYKVIGRDRQEYGPVDEEQVRRWIAERRVTADSQAQATGSEEWKRVGDLPEFADALRAAAAAPPPVNAAAATEAMAQRVLASGSTFDIGACISRGFDLVMNNLGLSVGAAVVAGLIMIVPLVGWFLSGPLTGGLAYVFLRRIRGAQAEVGDVFVGFGPLFWQLVLAHIVIGVLLSVGFTLCVLPGVYLWVAWTFAVPLIVDRQMDFWPAMEVSRKVVHKHWWSVFGLMLLVYIIACAGILACVIGIVVTAPIAFAAVMYAYEDVFGRTVAS